MKHNEFAEYFSIMESFNSGKITSRQFEEKYLALFKADKRLFPEEIFNVLNRLFSDVDTFVSDPEVRGRDDLDEEQLLACSREAYKNLTILLKAS